MTHSELRIGNLVWFRDKKIVQVSNLGHFFETTQIGLKEGIPYGSDDIEEYNPVQLTIDWLSKFGFDNGNHELSNCDLWGHYWIGDFEIDEESDYFSYNALTEIKYVHQLQNIYFAITGNELKQIEL